MSLSTISKKSLKESVLLETISSNYMDDFKSILNVPSMTKEYKPKVVQKFDKYLTPNDLKKYVLNSQKLQKLIDYYAELENCKRKDIEKKAKYILDEIALERNLPIIRWLGMCITAVTKRICSGIYVNEKNLNIVKLSLGNQPVLYLPSHRSYCDFILMSYICFHYEIEIPGIAAGMDFYSMVCMGNMLRKTGAFFMRRSFCGDEFYWDIFKEYMYALVAVYHIGVEFFIEGTRSRNFKALIPKIGLLSMALQPLFMGDVPDILIVPVSVSYERLLEEQLFVYELLGIPKPKESTKGFFKALKIIGERFGRMYVDFGKPISVKSYFGNKFNSIKHANISPHLQKLDKNEIAIIKDLANEIVYQQQLGIVITTFNLIAVYYAYKTYTEHCTSVNLEELCNGIILLKAIFEHLNAHVATDDKTLKFDIIETIKIHSNILKISTLDNDEKLIELIINKPPIIQSQMKLNENKLKGYRICDNVMQFSVNILNLQLYINPCMFWLSTPSIMILCAMKLSNENANGYIQEDQLRTRINELNSILSNEFVLIASKENEEFQRNYKFLLQFKIFEIQKNGIRFHKNEICDLLLSTIAPFLCIYLQLNETILEQFQNTNFNQKELLIAVQKRIENLLINHLPNVHPLCLALDNLNTALTSLAQNGYLYKKCVDNIVSYTHCKNEILQLRNKILQYCNMLPYNFYVNDNTNILAKL